MKTEEQIKNQIEWVKKVLTYEENKGQLQQAKLYAQLDTLEWCLKTLYFKKCWSGTKFSHTVSTGTTYYIDVYPFDVFENDNMCIRVYEDKEMTSEHECGNGLWCNSNLEWVDGNDELYFEEDTGNDSSVENEILDRVKQILQEKNII